MSLALRILLIVAAVACDLWILWKIRKHKVKLEDAIFWIIFAFVLVVIGIFPQILYMMQRLLGVVSPANLVFLIVIFVLMVKIFTMSITISQLKDKVEVLSSEIALAEHAAKDDDNKEK